MLSAEDNETLTRVGPGTPMGALLRRYWLPACLSDEVAEPDGPPARVRLLGEDLVAFRDTEGRIGLVEEQCPHRGASLFYGRNEEGGLRCTYHGWKFDVTGQCTDQRSELKPFCEKIQITSYPVHESGGIVWTYMGPEEARTPFRDFGTESLPADQASVVRETVYCNWVQSMDGDVDTAHISNLHQFDAIDDVPDDGSDQPGYPSNYMSMRFWRHDPRSLIEVDDTWYGFRYAGLRTTPNGHQHARISAWTFPGATIIAAIPFNTRLIVVVPVDDVTTYRYNLTTQPPANPRGLGGPPFFTYEKYPFTMPKIGTSGTRDMPRNYTRANDYGMDRVAQKGTSYSGIPDFRSQDNMATETAGPVYDRTREHLGSTDVAVIRMHRLLLRAAKALREAGTEPPAVRGDFRSIRGAEKILEPGEDWRVLGTDDDPVVKEALAARPRP
ncbi:MAG: Rieske 2Fe-2S domain-containing protein [Nocardiopsaceae bacterium]|nr:Rieske 2Fe-2S domain-containing protein [Nocardiopsaceae bacterium]